MSRLGSLRWRLALLYAGIAAGIIVLVLSIIGAAVETALIESTAERLEIEAGLVVADAGGGRKGTRATELAAGDLALVLGGNGTAVAILDADGRTLAAEGNGAASEILDVRLARSDYAAVIAEARTLDAVHALPGGDRALVVAAPVQLRTTGPGNGKGGGQGVGRGLGNQGRGVGPPQAAEGPPNAVAQLAISLDGIDAALGELRARAALAGFAIFLGAVALAWLVTLIGFRPLDRIAGAADRIASGDLEARAALPDGADEVGRLGRAFDGMAERVDATIKAQRQFAADASHELRSPLTVLGGYVDVLAASDIDPETRAGTLVAMRREIDRLTRLSGDLLLLTQLEAGGGRLAPRAIDLGEVMEDIGVAARVIGDDRRIEVVLDRPLPVVVDPDRLTQALMNLVDNAVRHSPPGGTVRLTATRMGDRAVAEVANGGDRIAEEELAHVFDRFYRATNGGARSDGQHAGLGLAIVKAIAEASGGSVSAASNTEETRFSILLPVAP
jgi:two-component system OmpR family sensor kinase